MNALEKLDARWEAGGRICVGLDSDFELLPPLFKNNGVYSGQRSFNRAIVNATDDLALAYKLNLADYIEHGSDGLHALIDSCKDIHHYAPQVPIIVDCNLGDVLPEKNAKYSKFVFEQCGADAMTAQVYAGGDVAAQISMLWNRNGNCGLIVGATYPEQIAEIRRFAHEIPIFSSGIGRQVGDFSATIRAGVIPDKGRLLVSEGRSIIFAPYKNVGRDDHTSFAEAARKKLLDRTVEYNTILEREAA